MAKVICNAGVCGFITEISAESEDMANALMRVSSQCPAYSSMEGVDYEIDAFASCFAKVGQSPVYDLFRETSLHSACPVPSAALKAIEAACGLALPRDVSFTVTE